MSRKKRELEKRKKQATMQKQKQMKLARQKHDPAKWEEKKARRDQAKYETTGQ